MTVSILIKHDDVSMLIHGPIARAIGFPLIHHVTPEHTLYIFDYSNPAKVREYVELYLSRVNINMTKNWKLVTDTTLKKYFREHVEVELDFRQKLLRKYATPEILSQYNLMRK